MDLAMIQCRWNVGQPLDLFKYFSKLPIVPKNFHPQTPAMENFISLISTSPPYSRLIITCIYIGCFDGREDDDLSVTVAKET